MRLGTFKLGTLYHGTSKARLATIKKDGFKIGTAAHHDRWLHPRSLYFVQNSPLLALRFGLLATKGDTTGEPAVIEVTLKSYAANSILDLTSDAGRHLLFVGYKRIEFALNSLRPVKNSKIPDEYHDDLHEKLKQANEVAIRLVEGITKEKESINWDSVAIQLIAIENDKSIVVAAVAEGKPLSKIFLSELFTHSKSSYSGQRTRDHIEICVLDPSIISSKIREHKEMKIKARFNTDYSGHLLDHYSRD